MVKPRANETRTTSAGQRAATRVLQKCQLTVSIPVVVPADAVTFASRQSWEFLESWMVLGALLPHQMSTF